ncbi:MAG: LpxL/LpxP family Kdo(2)-lipid IV(A) lauroyl/palmitoleoyl acyltransferase [Steroidobacteraceae bacterium]
MSPRLFAPRYWPTWMGLGLLRILAPLPLPILLWLGKWLGRVVRYLPVGFVRIARRNLELCLPELTTAQRERLLREHFESIGIALFETALAWWASDQRIQQLTDVAGLEHLAAAQAHGKGVILLSAHFTTLEIGARALAARMPLNVMYRPTNNEVMGRFLSNNRALRTRRAIRRDDVRTLVTALKANEPVWYAPDQSYRNKGAQMVPLFGIPCATNTATSRLAKMTGAAVLPYFPERLPNGRYRMIILPPLAGFPSDDSIADATRFHQLIEDHVRKVPAQYLWIHRRFKGLSEDYPDYYRK